MFVIIVLSLLSLSSACYADAILGEYTVKDALEIEQSKIKLECNIVETEH